MADKNFMTTRKKTNFNAWVETQVTGVGDYLNHEEG